MNKGTAFSSGSRPRSGSSARSELQRGLLQRGSLCGVESRVWADPCLSRCPGCLSGEAGDGAGKGHGCQRRAAQPPQAGEPAARAQVRSPLRSPLRAASCSAGRALVQDGTVPHALFGATGTFPGAQLIAGSSAGTNGPPLATVPACTRSFGVFCLGACKHRAL